MHAPAYGSPPKRRLIPGLDLLRCVAILAVFIFHYGKTGVSWVNLFGKYGWAGVDLFFVLSGFLIGSQVFTQLSQERFDVGRFYWRRATRILPNYWVVLALYFIFPILIERSYMPPVWRFLTFTVNFGSDLSNGAAFSHAWSLCVEEHFYLLFPGIAWLLTRSGSARRSILAVVFFIGAGIASRAWAWDRFVRPWLEPVAREQWIRAFMAHLYYPSYQRLDGLVVGAALAAISVYRHELWVRLQRHSGLFFALGMTSLAWIYWAEHSKQELLGTAISYPLIALSLGALLIASVGEETWVNRREIPIIHIGAVLSYSFYLVHKQTIHVTLLLGERYGFDPKGVFLFAASFAASLLFAGALYLVVERPIMKWRER